MKFKGEILDNEVPTGLCGGRKGAFFKENVEDMTMKEALWLVETYLHDAIGLGIPVAIRLDSVEETEPFMPITRRFVYTP